MLVVVNLDAFDGLTLFKLTSPGTCFEATGTARLSYNSQSQLFSHSPSTMSFSSPVVYESAVDFSGPIQVDSPHVMAHNPYYFDDSQVVLKASPFTWFSPSIIITHSSQGRRKVI
jgi:hypothetical protein